MTDFSFGIKDDPFLDEEEKKEGKDEEKDKDEAFSKEFQSSSERFGGCTGFGNSSSINGFLSPFGTNNTSSLGFGGNTTFGSSGSEGLNFGSSSSVNNSLGSRGSGFNFRGGLSIGTSGPSVGSGFNFGSGGSSEGFSFGGYSEGIGFNFGSSGGDSGSSEGFSFLGSSGGSGFIFGSSGGSGFNFGSGGTSNDGSPIGFSLTKFQPPEEHFRTKRGENEICRYMNISMMKIYKMESPEEIAWNLKFNNETKNFPEKIDDIKDRFEKFEFENESEMKLLVQDLEEIVKQWRESSFSIPEIEKEIPDDININVHWKDIEIQDLVDLIHDKYENNLLDSSLEIKIHQLLIQLPKSDKSLKKLSFNELEKHVIKTIIQSNPMNNEIEDEIKNITNPLLEKQKIVNIKKNFKWEYLPYFSKRRDFMNLSFKEICKKAWESEQEITILKEKLKQKGDSKEKESNYGLFIPSKQSKEPSFNFE